jgi:uncharacterized protein YidB (DUF937 family)
MGLLDVLNGMRNGPRGQPDPRAGGGMSPITMAILALLAYKGIEHLTAQQPQAAPGMPPSPMPANRPDPGQLGGALTGDLGGLLKGGLGSLLAGGAVGSVLSGGLSGLINQLQQSGQGGIAKSWVGTGPNQDISSSDLAKSIGIDDIGTLAKHVGLSTDQLLSDLSKQLPGVVDELTPDGRIPTGEELSRRL